MPRLLALLLVLLIPLSPAAVFADDDREVAQAQFKEAKRLYDEERYQPALKLFELAWQFSNSPNARLYIGKCHLALEQYEQAYNELTETLSDTAETGDPKYDNTRRAAAAELALLEAKVGRILVVLADPSRETSVKVAGAPFDALGRAVAVPTGTVEVEANSRDATVTRQARVTTGKTTTVAIYFPPTAAAREVGTSVPRLRSEPGHTGTQLGGFVAIGVGGAALVTGGILGGFAAGRFQALDSACASQPCDEPSVTGLIDGGKTLELVSYIMLGVGGASALTGGALVLFGGAPDEDVSAALDVAPLPGGGFLQLTARF